MVCDGLGCPLACFLSPGQMSDSKDALALLSALPSANLLPADESYDADWFREAFEDKGLPPASLPGAGARTRLGIKASSTSSITASKISLPVSRADAG